MDNLYISSEEAMEILRVLLRENAATPANLREWLSDACAGGHLECVEVLVERLGAQANDPEALARACGSGNEGVVSYLLERGADVNAPAEEDGDGPLHTACLHNRVHLLAVLRDAGAVVNARGRLGGSPLHRAVTHASFDLVKTLLSHECEADVNQEDDHGETPLMLAITEKKAHIAGILLGNGADVAQMNEFGFSPIHRATIDKQPGLVKLLLDHRADPEARSSRGETALHLAVEFNTLSVMNVLIEGGADVNAKIGAKAETPLFLACKRNHTDAILMLVEKGADVNARRSYGETLLHACVDNDVDVARVVVALDVDLDALNEHGNTTLFLAASRNGISLVKILAEGRGADAGANIDHPCGLFQRTALHEAARLNHSEMVNTLIQLGASVIAQNAHGRTPLMVACSEGSRDAAEALLRHGVDVRAEDLSGWTALHVASALNMIDCVQMLLDVDGCDINASSEAGHGRTALHEAVRHNRFEVVKLLLEHRAEARGVDQENRSPAYYAWEGNYHDILRLFTSERTSA